MQSDCISISNSLWFKPLFPYRSFTGSGFTAHGYRRPLSSSRTRFPPDFPLRSGTDCHFPSPVPGFRPFSLSDRVQIAIFLLLYPVSVRFSAQIGYRSPFSFSCTRFPSDFPLRSGTDRHFPSPVPGFRPFSRSDRVQISQNLLLYPTGSCSSRL